MIKHYVHPTYAHIAVLQITLVEYGVCGSEIQNPALRVHVSLRSQPSTDRPVGLLPLGLLKTDPRGSVLPDSAARQCVVCSGGAKGLLDLAYHHHEGCTYMRLELDAVNLCVFSLPHAQRTIGFPI